MDVPLPSRRLAISNTLEFLLSETRDAAAAKPFFSKALGASHTVVPRVITVDKNAAYPKALGELKAESTVPEECELRPVKYLNNIVEQDHRAHQTVGEAGDGLLFVRDGLANPCRGYEVMNMIRTGQMQGVNKGESSSQAAFIARLFGVAS